MLTHAWYSVSSQETRTTNKEYEKYKSKDTWNIYTFLELLYPKGLYNKTIYRLVDQAYTKDRTYPVCSKTKIKIGLRTSIGNNTPPNTTTCFAQNSIWEK